MARGDVKAAIKDWLLNDVEKGHAHVLLKFQWYFRESFTRDEVRDAVLELLEYEVLVIEERGHGETRRFRLSDEFAKEMARTRRVWCWTVADAT